MGTVLVFNHNSSNLTSEIESLRERMNRLGEKHGPLHPDVQSCSRELDKLLIQFCRRKI